MEQQGAKYEGWAVVELFGHQREAGFVTTQYFGDKAMFQIDVPEIQRREVTLKQAQYVQVIYADHGGTEYVPAGTVVTLPALPGRSRLVIPGAIYAINPSSEEVVRAMHDTPDRAIRIVKLPAEVAQLPAGEVAEYPDPEDGSDDEDEDE